jgi:DNA-binding CsgD family transcriptional regulator
VTAVASALYYKEIRKVQTKYEEAKGIVGDVVISFDADMERERQELSVISNKMGVLLSENKHIQKKIESHSDQMRKLATKIEVPELDPHLSTQLEELQKNITNLVNSHKRIDWRVTKIEQVNPQASVPQETKIKTAIPIRREKALASLTQTELEVLEVLAKEGRKTAPEIKQKINLTREHTARLMKNLYERGYLERRTEKIPYSYSIKDEMLKILKKASESQ